jgi:hypothetical protein
MLGQRPRRPVAGGVEIEGFLYERSALLIHDHGTNVLVADERSLGQIPDGRLERRAAIQVLLIQPLLVDVE